MGKKLIKEKHFALGDNQQRSGHRSIDYQISKLSCIFTMKIYDDENTGQRSITISGVTNE